MENSEINYEAKLHAIEKMSNYEALWVRNMNHNICCLGLYWVVLG